MWHQVLGITAYNLVSYENCFPATCPSVKFWPILERAIGILISVFALKALIPVLKFVKPY
jgi:hypothetical protein